MMGETDTLSRWAVGCLTQEVTSSEDLQEMREPWGYQGEDYSRHLMVSNDVFGCYSWDVLLTSVSRSQGSCKTS